MHRNENITVRVAEIGSEPTELKPELPVPPASQTNMVRQDVKEPHQGAKQANELASEFKAIG